MTQKARKTSSNGGDSRQNRIILGRTICLMVLFGVAAFIPLLGRLWQIQIVDGEWYQELAIEQQTQDMLVTAPRGTIYDTQGNLMAVSISVQNVVISPRDITAAAETKRESGERKRTAGETPTAAEAAALNSAYEEFIAEHLAEILDMEAEDLPEHYTVDLHNALQMKIEMSNGSYRLANLEID